LQDAGHLPRQDRRGPDELRTELRSQAEREAGAYRDDLAAPRTGTSQLPARQARSAIARESATSPGGPPSGKTGP